MEIAFGDFHDSFSPGEAISRSPRDHRAGNSSMPARVRQPDGLPLVSFCLVILHKNNVDSFRK
jgi:hypothetical protein